MDSLQKACFESKPASQGGLNIPGLKKFLITEYPEHENAINATKVRKELEALCRDIVNKSATTVKEPVKKLDKIIKTNITKIPIKKVKIVKSPPNQKPKTARIPLYAEPYSSGFVDYQAPVYYKSPKKLAKPTIFLTKANGNDMTLKDALMTWMGLQTMTLWNLDKKYSICKKNEIIGCLIPKDPIEFVKFFNNAVGGTSKSLSKLMKHFPNGFALSNFSGGGNADIYTIASIINKPLINENIGAFVDLAESENITYGNPEGNCYIVSNKLLSETCVRIWNTGAIITNIYDGKQYKMIEKIPCITNCELFSYVYQDVFIPNNYFIVFAFGKLIENKTKIYATVTAMLFVLNYLSKYLKPGNTITFFGHSVGFTNSLMISQVLAYTDEDFKQLFRKLQITRNQITSCPYGEQGKNYDICTMHDKRPGELSAFITESINEFQKFRDANIDLIKNIRFIGSGGAPLISSDIPPSNFDLITSYYNKNIIHFALGGKSPNGSLALDPFINKKIEMKNTPIYLMLTDITPFTNKVDDMKLLNVEYFSDPFFQLREAAEGGMNLHAFESYRKAILLLSDTPKFLNPINNAWNKVD